MTAHVKTLDIVGTIDRVTDVVRVQIAERLTTQAGADTEIDLPRDIAVHPHLTWEAGWGLRIEAPAIFVHAATRGLAFDTDTGIAYRGGPDLNVGFYVRAHPERLASALRLGTYIAESLWSIAEDLGYHPHVHNLTSFGKSESTDWGVAGTVLFGTVDGAPTRDPF